MRKQIAVLSLVLLVAFASAGFAQEATSGYGDSFDRLTNNVTFGGYFEQEFEDKERSEANFDQHRTILFFGAQPHERIRFFSELEIEHGGFSDVKLEQAWLELALTENHNFRGGIDLIPVGRLNLEHDGNLRDFVFRPTVDDKLIPTTWFESGLSFNGDLTEQLSYTVGISNGLSASSDSSTVGTFGEIEDMRGGAGTNMTEGDDNDDKAIWGRLAWTPLLGTEIGLSGYQSRYSVTSSDSDITFVALDFNHIQGPWEFKGEWVNVDKDERTPGATISDVSRGFDDASGGYIETAYHFFPEGWYDAWFARGFDNPTFTALARYETLDFDGIEDKAGNKVDELVDRDIISLGMNYRPVEQAALKISYDIEDRDSNTAQDQDRFGFGMVLGF